MMPCVQCWAPLTDNCDDNDVPIATAMLVVTYRVVFTLKLVHNIPASDVARPMVPVVVWWCTCLKVSNRSLLLFHGAISNLYVLKFGGCVGRFSGGACMASYQLARGVQLPLHTFARGARRISAARAAMEPVTS